MPSGSLLFRVSLEIAIHWAAFIMVVLLPLYWFIILIPLVIPSLIWDKDMSESTTNDLLLLSMAVTASFTITFLALLVGHLAVPDLWVPQTFQMLASNVVFDGVTMVATFSILSRAVACPGMFRILAAVWLDFVVAALLACCSLYFALVFTERALSVGEILNILIFRSPDGAGFELGPYFWVMHTTFLPTLSYLALILLAWTGKALLIPVSRFFETGSRNPNPLHLTSMLFGIFLAIFTALAMVLQVVA